MGSILDYGPIIVTRLFLFELGIIPLCFPFLPFFFTPFIIYSLFVTTWIFTIPIIYNRPFTTMLFVSPRLPSEFRWRSSSSRWSRDSTNLQNGLIAVMAEGDDGEDLNWGSRAGLL